MILYEVKCFAFDAITDFGVRTTGDMKRVAFVGAGPTAIYTFCAFLKTNDGPADVVIYEEQGRAGLGMPYRPGWMIDVNYSQ